MRIKLYETSVVKNNGIASLKFLKEIVDRLIMKSKIFFLPCTTKSR